MRRAQAHVGSSPTPSAMNDSYFLLREKYNGKKSPLFYLDLVRLSLGEPLAYVIGWQPFLDLKIDLRLRPLIPRPETEFWLSEYVIKKYKQKNAGAKLKVLDIFTGSGCIGLAFAKQFPGNALTLSDKSRRALKQAKINADINNIINVEFIHSDIFKNIKEKFDLILANPPYVPLRNISPPVLLYEPLSATLADQNGTATIKDFLSDAHKHLGEGGEIFMEIEESQGLDVLAFVKKQKKWSLMEILEDQYGKDRVLHLATR